MTAAVLFIVQAMKGRRSAPPIALSDGEPRPPRAARGWQDAFAGQPQRLLAAGQFLLIPIMRLSSATFPLLFVECWRMPVFVPTLLFAVSTGRPFSGCYSTIR